MLIAYLPAEKMLVNADLYAAPAPGDPPPVPTPACARCSTTSSG
jgi:hypothetical protein